MAAEGSNSTKTGLGLVGVLLACAAVAGLFIGFGSDNPPKQADCLPVSSAADSSSTSAGGLQKAADAAVAAGKSQGIDVGVVITDAGKRSDRLAVGKQDLMPSASVIKLAVAIAAGKRIDAGSVSADQVKPLLNPMISVSDNTATNQLVALLGGASVVNDTIAGLGVTSNDARLGRELGAPVSGPDPNVASAGGIDKILGVIYDSTHSAGTPASTISQSSAQMIVDAMRNQQVNTKWGAVLPHDQIAHKTGELGGTSHDVGWFISDKRWLEVTIMTNKPGGSDQAAGNEIIKRFATDAFAARSEQVTPADPRGPPAATGGATSGDKAMPLKAGVYQLSSPYGPRDGAMHQGQDFAAPLGTPIYAATSGTVAAAGPASGFGNWIVVDFTDRHGSNVYGHMRAGDLKVKTGDKVSAGQLIAAVGSEGESSGPHLHFETWVDGTRLHGGHAIDPMPWLKGATNPTGSATTSIQVRNAADVTDLGPGTTPPGGAGCGNPTLGDATALRPGSVPAAFEPWIIRAAKTCPEVTAPLIAAQLKQEGNFNVNAHNAGSGADGPAQFLPDTWAAKAVDGDGNGTKDPRSIPDAVMTQAAYDCELAASMKKALSAGQVKGDLTELWLSAYNCGPGATLGQGQVCQNAQTLGYVKHIPEMARTEFAAATPSLVGGTFGARVVAAAMRWLGTPYAWGGGTLTGPSRGTSDGGGAADAAGDFNKVGFDCSGLTRMAVAMASGGKTVIARTSQGQVLDPQGKPVPINQLQPGDIVFPTPNSPGHVVIYIGNGQIVQAPQSGDVVKVSPLSSQGSSIVARRFG